GGTLIRGSTTTPSPARGSSPETPVGINRAMCERPLPPSQGNVHTLEERDDAHDSFLQVKKGLVLLRRMETITTYKNQHGQRRSVVLSIFRTKHVKRLKTKRLKLKVHFQMSKDTIFSRPHTKALCNASYRSLLSHQVNDLQDQLQADRANTQEIINLERAEREQLEGKLKEEHAERERLLEAERTSRLKFEKNMMAKFAEFSKQMGTQKVFTNRIDKENSNPNFQNTLLQRPSPNKAVGARPNVISSNALIHASTRISRMFKAI
ncbi:hypothetical protein ZWY2020_037898, partial [Hordeum vulgare]